MMSITNQAERTPVDLIFSPSATAAFARVAADPWLSNGSSADAANARRLREKMGRGHITALLERSSEIPVATECGTARLIVRGGVGFVFVDQGAQCGVRDRVVALLRRAGIGQPAGPAAHQVEVVGVFTIVDSRPTASAPPWEQ